MIRTKKTIKIRKEYSPKPSKKFSIIRTPPQNKTKSKTVANTPNDSKKTSLPNKSINSIGNTPKNRFAGYKSTAKFDCLHFEKRSKKIRECNI